MTGVRTGARPLEGLRVAVTRPGAGAQDLAALLQAEGAEPVVLPLLELAEPVDRQPLIAAAARLDSFDWVIFTSANAVRALQRALDEAHVALPPRGRVAAAGEATARAVHELLGWRVDTVPDSYSGAETAAAVQAAAAQAAGSLSGAQVLWPRARDALTALPSALERAGAVVEAPEAYRMVERPSAAARLAALMRAGRLDAVTFTSPSCVLAMGAEAGIPPGVVVAVIGPTTADAARAAGLTVHVQAQDHTGGGLVAGLVRHYAGA